MKIYIIHGVCYNFPKPKFQIKENPDVILTPDEIDSRGNTDMMTTDLYIKLIRKVKFKMSFRI